MFMVVIIWILMMYGVILFLFFLYLFSIGKGGVRGSGDVVFLEVILFFLYYYVVLIYLYVIEYC